MRCAQQLHATDRVDHLLPLCFSPSTLRRRRRYSRRLSGGRRKQGRRARLWVAATRGLLRVHRGGFRDLPRLRPRKGYHTHPTAHHTCWIPPLLERASDGLSHTRPSGPGVTRTCARGPKHVCSIGCALLSRSRSLALPRFLPVPVLSLRMLHLVRVGLLELPFTIPFTLDPHSIPTRSSLDLHSLTHSLTRSLAHTQVCCADCVCNPARGRCRCDLGIRGSAFIDATTEDARDFITSAFG